MSTRTMLDIWSGDAYIAGNHMKFFLELIPPTTTAQEKKVAIIKGKPVFYEPKRIKTAKELLIKHLAFHAPTQPLEGAVELTVRWFFPCGKTHKDNQWKTSRPDTDNLDKLLKDVMTQIGFWKDDAQVVREIIEKKWSANPGIEITIRLLI